MPWGGVWNVVVLNITSYPMFNWFFTLVIVFGLISFLIGTLISVINRWS